MKLSKLIQSAQVIMDKYGDREVLVDTEAATFDCHMVEVKAVTMPLRDESYKEDPKLLESFGTAIIHLDNSAKSHG